MESTNNIGEKKSNAHKVFNCWHCGNKTVLYKVGEDTFKEEAKDRHESWFYWKTARMYICPVCANYTFTETSFFSEDHSPYDDDEPEEEIVFPINKMKSWQSIPNEIRKSYEAAIRTQKIDESICLMALRKVLELICNEKGATGKTLEQKIKTLAENKILPDVFEKASNITRRFGNDGAHESNRDASTYEVSKIIEFVHHIINYLYIIPKEIEDLERKDEKQDFSDPFNIKKKNEDS